MLVEQFETVFFNDRVRQYIVGNGCESGLGGVFGEAVRESDLEVLSLPHRRYFLMPQTA